MSFTELIDLCVVPEKPKKTCIWGWGWMGAALELDNTAAVPGVPYFTLRTIPFGTRFIQEMEEIEVKTSNEGFCFKTLPLILCSISALSFIGDG